MQVVPFLRALVNKRLGSIRPGAEIVIVDVDEASDRFMLRTASGALKSRPIAEIERLYKALQSEPAIHVDSFFGGSGSSRNQPETILAHHPQVEWLRIHGKKHLTFVPRPSHPLGTLREMDPIQAADVKKALAAADHPLVVNAVMLSSDPARAAKTVSGLGVEVQAISSDAYEVRTPTGAWWILNAAALGGNEGVYLVLPDIRDAPEVGALQVRGSRVTIHQTDGLLVAALRRS